uniref:ribonuclease H n=1 Tax=Podarcis muralis TaxID=64176 RepID=A0A670IN41_PODMU
MLKILQGRLKQYVDRELPEVQAGFRRGRGTRDQIANMRWIMEKAREFQKDIYFCFIDYAKAFDCVDHSKLWQVLKEMGVPDHLICLLRNLYVGQEAKVRTGYGTTDWFKIGKGVRQGCILSPCLFNLYAEFIMRKAGLDETQAGIKIAGRNINNLRYADDTTLMAESEEDLKNLLMRVKEESAKYGLKLNIKKTKIMATGPITSWQIEGEEMEAVRDFIFLGSMITADGDSSHEIKRRLLLGRKAMANLDNILKSRAITLPTKVRIVKAMVFPVVMYGSESWTIKKADRRRIDAFELWCWRRLLRVPWTAIRSNTSILKEIRPECSLEGQIVKLRLQYFGHLMRREDSLEKTLMLGKMEGTRRRGRQRMRWLDSVLEATNMSLTKLREAVEDRSAWRALVHGVAKSRTRLND